MVELHWGFIYITNKNIFIKILLQTGMKTSLIYKVRF